MPFLGKRLGLTRGDGFVSYEAENFAAQEQMGMQEWKGGALDYVPMAGHMPHAPLDPKIQKLIESTWTFAQPKEGATRGPVALGGHRNPLPPPSRGPVQIGSSRAPQPLPTTPTFHSAPPVKFKMARMAPHLNNVVPSDWKLMKDIPRVSAYAFRGDTRGPDAIKKAGGFQPPITRTDDHYVRNCIYPTFKAYLNTKLKIDISLEDFQKLIKESLPDAKDRQVFAYYSMWRSQIERESMHLGRMLAQEDLKGYISTSKATPVAKGFAKEGGTVYLLRVNGGFHVPSKQQHAWTSIFGEEEIASPFALGWGDVMGYRKVGPGKKFTGPIYYRPEFVTMDNQAFQQCHELLSGKRQG